MRELRLFLRAIVCTLVASSCALYGQSPKTDFMPAIRHAQPTADGARAILTGSTPPLAKAEYDIGAAPNNLAMNRMLLLLKPANTKAQQLEEYLRQIEEPGNANYHRWLTPLQFGEAYGVAKEDMQVVTDWLEQQGFALGPVSIGGQWIEFSGTVAQVEAAFNTSIHRYTLDGVEHIANAADLQIPAALSSVVTGVVSMNDFESKAAYTTVDYSAPPAGFTPAQFSAAYNLAPLYKSGTTGAGQSIAVIERSNIQLADVAAFRDRFSLPSNTPQVVVNGSDPGRNSDEIEALLDASWAGAVAPNALVKLIASDSTHATDGVDLSIAYAVDRAVSPVVEVGYVACESNLDAYHQQFYSAMWAQAEAEGITVVVATGNSGAAGCEGLSRTSKAATDLAVNGIASTPYNTAVGGTLFADFPITGQERVAETGWTTEAQAGGGGVSSLYATPHWQVAAGVPSADLESTGQRHRYLPDVSLNAGNLYDLCFEGSCGRGEMAVTSGTSMAAAAFAGVMALVDQHTRSAQGNSAPVLYALSRKGLALRDVTTASNRIPCVTGSQGCDASGMIGYWAAPGFDLATGLGSIDAAEFVGNYATAAATGTERASVSLSPATTTVLSGSSFTINVTVTSAVTNGAIPSGTVTFIDSIAGTLGTVTLSNGAASFSAPTILSAGTHTITGQYSGDSNYAPAASAGVTANVVQGTAVIVLTTSTVTPAYGTNVTAIATLQATATVNNLQPTGTVAFTVDSTPVGTAIVQAGTNSAAASLAIATPTPGNHMIGATYSGDTNFGALTATPVTIAAQKGTSITTLTATPPTLASGVPINLTATITSAVNGVTPSVGFTGNVVFYDGPQPIADHNQVNVTNNQATLANVTLDPTVVHIITAQYYGDGNWAASTSAPLTLTPAAAATVTTLTASPTTGFNGASVAFTAVVTGTSTVVPTAVPTGTVTFLDGTTAIGSGTLALNLGQSTATFATTKLSSGVHSVTAKYAGDINFAASASTPVSVTIGSYTVVPDTTNLTVVAGQSGSVIFTVTSGLGVPIQFSCQPPVGTDTGCSFSPPSVTGNGKTTMIISTAATSKAENGLPFKGGAAVLGCFVLLCLPFGGRSGRWLRRGTLVVLLLVAGASIFGCGSDNAKIVTGTPPGIQVFTVITSVTVNNQTTTQQFYISVNVMS